MVGPLHRFAHAESYLRAALEAAGLAPLSFATIVVRHDEGAPVPGQLVLARKA
jgi:predicted TPR repeat methyltransferase